jgi:hypothetical protein
LLLLKILIISIFEAPAPPCPTVPTCEEGYTLVERKPASSSAALTKKGGVKGTKGGVKGRRKPTPERLIECPEFDCVPLITVPTTTVCPPPQCPPGYDVIRVDVNAVCPEYRCRLPPKEDVCKVDESNFKTFDDTHYIYAICHHILAQDKENNKWSITGTLIPL